MHSFNTTLFIDTILLDDILQYNYVKQCIEFNVRNLFKKCFPGVVIDTLDFETAVTLVQKEIIKSNSNDLYTVKDTDELYFKANKAAWIFSVLFGDDVVLDWQFPVIERPKIQSYKNGQEFPSVTVSSFLKSIEGRLRPRQHNALMVKFDEVLRYVVYGKLENNVNQEQNTETLTHNSEKRRMLDDEHVNFDEYDRVVHVDLSDVYTNLSPDSLESLIGDIFQMTDNKKEGLPKPKETETNMPYGIQFYVCRSSDGKYSK